MKCLNCRKELPYRPPSAAQKWCSRKCYLTHPFESNSPLYKTWDMMIYRCDSPSSKDYKRYGARGIKVCLTWYRFRTFEKWALTHGDYQKGLKLERKNNEKGYSPGNCKFATPIEQANNRRGNLRITMFGETKTASQWSRDERCGLNKATLVSRIRLQELPASTAITHPLQPRINGTRKPIVGSKKHKLMLQSRTRLPK